MAQVPRYRCDPVLSKPSHSYTDTSTNQEGAVVLMVKNVLFFVDPSAEFPGSSADILIDSPVSLLGLSQNVFYQLFFVCSLAFSVTSGFG